MIGDISHANDQVRHLRDCRREFLSYLPERTVADNSLGEFSPVLRQKVRDVAREQWIFPAALFILRGVPMYPEFVVI